MFIYVVAEYKDGIDAYGVARASPVVPEPIRVVCPSRLPAFGWRGIAANSNCKATAQDRCDGGRRRPPRQGAQRCTRKPVIVKS